MVKLERSSGHPYSQAKIYQAEGGLAGQKIWLLLLELQEVLRFGAGPQFACQNQTSGRHQKTEGGFSCNSCYIKKLIIESEAHGRPTPTPTFRLPHGYLEEYRKRHSSFKESTPKPDSWCLSLI